MDFPDLCDVRLASALKCRVFGRQPLYLGIACFAFGIAEGIGGEDLTQGLARPRRLWDPSVAWHPALVRLRELLSPRVCVPHAVRHDTSHRGDNAHPLLSVSRFGGSEVL